MASAKCPLSVNWSTVAKTAELFPQPELASNNRLRLDVLLFNISVMNLSTSLSSSVRPTKKFWRSRKLIFKTCRTTSKLNNFIDKILRVLCRWKLIRNNIEFLNLRYEFGQIRNCFFVCD